MMMNLLSVLAAESNQSTLTTALITTAGVIISAILTATVSMYTARRKIQELKLTYEQKLREDYLANARQHARSIYVPLNTSVYRLLQSYNSFRATIHFKTGESSAERQEAFKTTAATFLQEFDELAERRGAYLTIELEQRLASFATFLKASLNAEAVARKTILTLFSSKVAFTGVLGDAFGAAAPMLNLSQVVLFYTFPFNVGAETVTIAAPLASREFEERFVKDTAIISSLIREVTLGGHTATSSP